MKKIISAILAMVISAAPVSAFTFPTPDWGALLSEKTQMVSETDFELYTEGPVDAAPYFGAKHEPRGGAYFGIIAENSEFVNPVGSYLTYFSMDDRQTDIYWPANEVIDNANSVVTIGYTVNSLGNIDYNTLRISLDNLARYNKPMLIRFANEMNVSALGDDPTAYVDAFRTAANMIHEYPNFAVVWSPNDLGALDRPFEYFYPGDEYVDWVGVSSYGKRFFQGSQNTSDKDARYFMTGDYAWTTNALKPIIKFMEENNINKPLMISEGGISTQTNYGEDVSWTAPRLRNMYYNTIMKYPQVKLINYFNTYRDEDESYYVADYQKSIPDKEYAKDILSEAVSCGAYIRSAGGSPEFVFAPASDSHTLTGENGIVNLYTLAYIPKKPDITVTYKLDGNWYHSVSEAPYKCGLSISGLSDGAHSVEISSDGISKSYTFYKKGNTICFGEEPQAAPISVTVNGVPVQFDTAPVNISGRILVPLRAIFNALNASVSWDADTKTAYASGRGHDISISVGSDELFKDGTSVSLDVPAQIIDSRIYVPTRAISEAMDCDVKWNGETNTVIITAN